MIDDLWVVDSWDLASLRRQRAQLSDDNSSARLLGSDDIRQPHARLQCTVGDIVVAADYGVFDGNTSCVATAVAPTGGDGDVNAAVEALTADSGDTSFVEAQCELIATFDDNIA